jgi:hypothetical protein
MWEHRVRGTRASQCLRRAADSCQRCGAAKTRRSHDVSARSLAEVPRSAAYAKKDVSPFRLDFEVDLDQRTTRYLSINRELREERDECHRA